MRLRYFVLLLAKAANDWLQEGICIAAWLVNHHVFQIVKQPITLVAHICISWAHVLCERLNDHGQIGANERAHFFLPQHCFETLLRLCLHLRVVVLEQLTISVNQVNEARWWILDRHALGAGKRLQLIDGFDSLLPIVSVATVDQCFHLFNQLAIYGLGNRSRALVKGVLCAIKSRWGSLIASCTTLHSCMIITHGTSTSTRYSITDTAGTNGPAATTTGHWIIIWYGPGG